MMKNSKIKSSKTVDTSTVLGQFEGMCADADITNENGLDITREVWENVFSSDIYKQAIELGWYIGYLGHPDDPNEMSFQDACIVMKEGHIDNDGKVYGKFDLVDTPVGRVVKSFIDAGVTFGISVRGAGDIIDNSVDPDTFVFRGFDLVTFPAYKEAIPAFTEIAASTNLETQKKYKAVCAAVKNNIKSINSAESIDLIQEQFAPQSEEYALLEDRKAELAMTEEEELDITKEQLEGVMQLYLDEKNKTSGLELELLEATTNLKKVTSTYNRKFKSVKRIMAAQMRDAEDEIASTVNSYQTIKAASSKLKKENISLQSQLDRVSAENDRLHHKVTKIQASIAEVQENYSKLSDENKQLIEENKILANKNLKYKQKIEAATADIQNREDTIADLRSELNETVIAATDATDQASNLDDKISKLQSEILAATALVEEYQNAYASLYANAVGVHLDNVTVTSTTSVKELQTIIGSSVMQTSQPDIQPTYTGEDDGDGDSLVTI